MSNFVYGLSLDPYSKTRNKGLPSLFMKGIFKEAERLSGTTPRGQQRPMSSLHPDRSSCFQSHVENCIALCKLSRKAFCHLLGGLEQSDGTFLLFTMKEKYKKGLLVRTPLWSIQSSINYFETSSITFQEAGMILLSSGWCSMTALQFSF